MQSRWNPAEAAGKSEFERLIYSSRLIGQEPALVLWGGGNTSLKQTETDFLGRQVRVLRVKGSGSDLASIDARGFPGVRLDAIMPLLEREQMGDEAMMDYLLHTLMEPGSPRPSIETLLHGFLPWNAIHHSHADASLYVADNSGGAALAREALGDDVVIVPYVIPGFRLAKVAFDCVQSHGGKPVGALLLHHGLFSWGDTCQESYERHIELVGRLERFVQPRRKVYATPPALHLAAPQRRALAAAVTPELRGMLCGGGSRAVMLYDDSQPVLDFISSDEGERLSQVGAATPDHMLNTRRLPLYVRPERLEAGAVLAALRQGVDRYVAEYRDYFARHNATDQMLDPYPRVVLVAGLGMFTQGRDYRAALIPQQIYQHTVGVIAGAEGVGEYRSLPEADAFAAEYFPLEIAKLKSLPPPPELAGRVALVTGGASGIGSGVAARLAAAGAHVLLTDVDLDTATEAATAISGRSGKGRCTALAMDVTNEAAVAAAFQEAVLTYGGLDILFSSAGTAPTGSIHDMDFATWEKSFAINTHGHFLVSRAAVRIMRRQKLGGSIIFNVTKNVLAPGKDFGAYSCAKAAEAQLCRILAIEHGAEKIRVNMVHPDAILTDLWSPQVRADRAKAYGITPEQLPEFLRSRTLLKEPVHAEDVAEAVFWFASDRSAKSTGNMLVVDAGFRDSFPR